MTSSHPSSPRVSLDSVGLGALSFEWQGDRYSHTWTFGEQAETVLSSKESDASVAWPLSPPLQQVHRQSFDDGREVLFGVGMAGRGHWSASFTLVPDLKCWIVELACRSPIQPVMLASTYEMHGDWEKQPAGAVLEFAGQRLQIEAIAPSSKANWEGGVLSILPERFAADSVTVQWGFRLRVLAGS